MRKKRWIFAGVLCLTLCMAVLTSVGQSVVQAKEQPIKQGGGQLKSQQPSAHGNIVYQDGGEKAEIYAADFSLLYEKLTMASEDVFDPSGYAHVQQWEEEVVPVLIFDAVDETWLDDGYQMEEELGSDELSDGDSETTDEDMSMSEPEEASETTDEETATPEPEEQPETTDEETTTPETDETPEVTVSGNDIEHEDNAEEQ